jgi:hypothetical protein
LDAIAPFDADTSSHQIVATGLRLRYEIASPILSAEHIFSTRVFTNFLSSPSAAR